MSILDQFFATLDISDDSSEVVTTANLHTEYVSFVDAKTSISSVRTNARARLGFSTHFKLLARKYNVKYVSQGRRGYKVKIQQVSRASSHLSTHEEIKIIQEEYIKTHIALREIKP